MGNETCRNCKHWMDYGFRSGYGKCYRLGEIISIDLSKVMTIDKGSAYEVTSDIECIDTPKYFYCSEWKSENEDE